MFFGCTKLIQLIFEDNNNSDENNPVSPDNSTGIRLTVNYNGSKTVNSSNPLRVIIFDGQYISDDIEIQYYQRASSNNKSATFEITGLDGYNEVFILCFVDQNADWAFNFCVMESYIFNGGYDEFSLPLSESIPINQGEIVDIGTINFDDNYQWYGLCS